MKYESWVLVKKEVMPNLNGCRLLNDEGKILRNISYTYACPYCHKEYPCSISNRLTFRKCRYCDKRVSPYKGEVIESAWMSEDEVVKFNQQEEANR